MSEVLLVTGMSGAGRSTVVGRARRPRLVRHRQHADRADRARRRTGAIGLARVRRGGLHRGALGPGAARRLARRGQASSQKHENAKILFLDAPDDVLIHRFEGNRRRHPFEAATLAESIKGERALLQSIRDAADLVIDTGSINTNQLRSRIVETFTEMAGSARCACRSSPSATPTASRATSTSSSTAASCRTPTGSRSCAPCRDSTSRSRATCSTRSRPSTS
jgi:RNase adapter protein RapZ